MFNLTQTHKFTKLLYTLFIISLFFPLRKVFFTNSAYLTGAYSDFTSFSLYLSDLLLLTTWWSILISRGGARDMAHHVVKNLKWLIFWLILAFLWHFKSNTSLNCYFLLKYAELIVAYETTRFIFSNYPIKQTIFKIFLILGSVQSIIALSQFLLQKSIGLKYLGENVLNANILGVAKIVSGGTKYIRGYGTFPHPNLLSAFLIVVILVTIYLIYTSNSIKLRVFYYFLLFLNILGLTVTFSRGAFISLGIGLCITFFYHFIKHNTIFETQIDFWLLFITVFFSIILSFGIFYQFLMTRTTFSDQATIERSEYNQIGINILKNQPLFGTGIGESVLHMEQFSGKKLETWEKQPIHNYFLLSAAELGILGAIILFWIFISHLIVASSKYQASSNNPTLASYNLLLATVLICFLILMLFDHYFYTIQQTQLLLWVFLGIIASEIKNPQEGEILNS